MSRVCQFTIPASRDIERAMDAIAGYGSFDAAEQFLANLNAKCTKSTGGFAIVPYPQDG